MKSIFRMFLLVVAIALLAVGATCQTSHSVDLTWAASSDAAANPTLTYNVYRAGVSCPTDGTRPTGMTRLASVSVASYHDAAVSVGQSYCYAVTAALNGGESSFSNTAGGTIPIAPPGTVTILIK